MALTSTTMPNFEIPHITFGWLDYAFFGTMLGLSALIGVYFGCYRKQNTANDYLLGGKTMKVFPVAMSLIASHTSGIAILSVPADIYIFGANYWWMCNGIIISSLVSCYVFMPVFLKLQLTSTFEYLQLRFDNKIRVLASFIFALSAFLYNPIVIYTPALAFSQATDINLYWITPIVCIVCIFYTTVGGLKAVVWTDTLQGVSIAGAIVIVLCMGIASAGGFSNIWAKSLEGQRLDIFNFDIDPTLRDSFWALTIGASASWICNFSVNQGTVQRFLAVPSIHHARKVVLIFCIGVVFIKTVSTFTGLIIFTKYSDCDPLSTKQVTRNDQLLPYYVMDVAGKVPGLPGIFIAGVFSAGLSTLSTTLNTLACTIYEDFISPFMPADITQEKTSNILKLIVLITGVISTLLVFVVEHLGGVLPLTFSVAGITGGPLLGLFCLGMFFPRANSRGALFGGIGGLILCSWMVIGNQLYSEWGLLKDFSKPLSTEGCNFYVNITQTVTAPPPAAQPFVIYRISFWYYTFLGTMVVIIIGLIVSWFTSKDDPPVDRDLISPIVHFLLPKEKGDNNSSPSSDCLNGDQALQLVKLNSENKNGNNT